MSNETIIYVLSHTEIIKDVCNDDELSWGAKGIAMYLYQNKVANLEELKALASSPEDETDDFIKELLDFEYIETVKTN